MKSSKPDYIMLRISQEFYYMCKVLESCSTNEQLYNVQEWISQIFNNWEFLFDDISLSDYGEHYKSIIIDISETLKNKIQQKLDIFNEEIENQKKEEEQQPKYPKPIVIKGFA